MIKVAEKIRQAKADRLISITSVWKDGANTLYYHLAYNGKPGVRQIDVKIPGGENVESIVKVFKHAALFEAEVTELFGVKFLGNPFSGKRLFQADGNQEAVRAAFCPGTEVGKDA